MATSLRTYVQQRGGRTCLYVQTTSPKSSLTPVAAAAAVPTSNSTWEDGLWWLWGRKWLIHRQLTRMEIDSADGSKHTERCGVVGSDLYLFNLGCMMTSTKATIESIRLQSWSAMAPRDRALYGKMTGMNQKSTQGKIPVSVCIWHNDSIRRSTICLQPKAHVVQVYAKVQSTRRSRLVVSPVLRAR
jgi:hypothetical protein